MSIGQYIADLTEGMSSPEVTAAARAVQERLIYKAPDWGAVEQTLTEPSTAPILTYDELDIADKPIFTPTPPTEGVGNIAAGSLYSEEFARYLWSLENEQQFIPKEPSPLYNREFADYVFQAGQAARARGETPNTGIFNFDSPPFRDFDQIPFLPAIPDVVGGLKDIGKWILIGGGVLIGAMLLSSYLKGRKK